MKFAAVILFVGLAFGDQTWEYGKMLTYKHYDEVKLGYPHTAESSSIPRLTCNINIQNTAHDFIYVNLDDVKLKDAKSTYIQALQSPFSLKMDQGVIKRLKVSPDISPMSVNMIKAKMSVLNLNLEGLQLYNTQPILKVKVPNTEKSYFSVYEETHYGVCEVSYSISPLMEYLSECKQDCEEMEDDVKGSVDDHIFVVKSVDFRKCMNTPMYRHTMPPVATNNPETPIVDSLYSRMTSTSYILRGDRSRYQIKSIKHHEKVALNPLRGETEKVLLQTMSSWKLVAITAAAVPQVELDYAPRLLDSVVSDMFPYMGSSVSKSPLGQLKSIYRSKPSLIQKAVDVITELCDDVESYDAPEQKAVSSKFITLEEAIHYMDFDDLVQIYDKICEVLSGPMLDTAKSFYLDACAMCGNNPCVSFIKKIIVEEKVNKQQAVTYIMTLPMSVKTPTPALLQQLLDIVEAVKSTGDILYSSSILAVSNIIYHHCVKPSYIPAVQSPKSSYIYCQVDTPQVQAFVTMMINQMKTAEDIKVKIAVMKALTNTGHPLALDVLKPIITGEVNLRTDVKDFLRVQAITSVHRMAECHKQVIIDLLMGVYSDLTDSVDCRMAAASVVMSVRPSHQILSKLALSTWYEPSRQVHSLIYSFLLSLSMVQKPVLVDVNYSAKHAISMCKPYKIMDMVPYSLQGIYGDYLSKYNVGAAAGATVLASSDALVPKFIYAMLLRHEGYPYKSFEASVASQGIDELIIDSFGPAVLEKIQALLKIGNRFIVPSASDDIFNKFNIQKDGKAAIATAQIKFYDLVEGIFTMDDAPGFANKAIDLVIHAAKAVKAGIVMNIQKTVSLVDTTIMLPTELGFPCEIRMALPVTVSLKGDFKAEISQSPTMDVSLKPLISAEYQSKVTAYDFRTEKFIQSGVVARVQAGVPISVKARADITKYEAAITLTPTHAGGLIIPVHALVTPYTVYERFNKLITPVIHHSSFRPVKRHPIVNNDLPIEALKSFTGLDVHLHHRTDMPFNTVASVISFVKKHYQSPLSMVNFPYYVGYMEQLVNYNKIDLTYRSASSVSKQFKGLLKYFVTDMVEEKEEKPTKKAKRNPKKHGKILYSKKIDSKSMELGKLSYAKKIKISSSTWTPEQKTDVTVLKLQTPIPEGSTIQGLKVHNLEMMVEAIGAKLPLVYKGVVSAVVSKDYKFGHVKYVLNCDPVPTISESAYQVMVESSLAKYTDSVQCDCLSKHGPVEGVPKSMKLKVKFYQNDQQKSYAAQHPSVKQCKADQYDTYSQACQEAKYQRKSFNAIQAEFSSGSKLPVAVHHMVRGADQILAWSLLPYLHVDYDIVPKKGQIVVSADLDAQTKRCNMVLSKEYEKVSFRKIPMPVGFFPFVPIVPHNMDGLKIVTAKLEKLSPGMFKPTCEISADSLVTFDGVKVAFAAFPMDKDVLLAMYKGGVDSTAVVLVKKSSGVIVKIIKNGKEVEVTQSGESGVTVTIDSDSDAQVVDLVDGVQIVSPIYQLVNHVGIYHNVLISSDKISIQISPIFRGKMTGVCGNYNGEKYDDLNADETKNSSGNSAPPEDKYIHKYYQSIKYYPSVQSNQPTSQYMQTPSHMAKELVKRFTSLH